MATDSTRRLHHAVPSWVRNGAVFHIRIRISAEQSQNLTNPLLAAPLLKSAAYYHDRATWHCHLMLLMPDHLHALLGFSSTANMAIVIGRRKAWQKRTLGVEWQENFFDHRIRDDRELVQKETYIRHNPVGKQLCAQPQDWPWVLEPETLNQVSG